MTIEPNSIIIDNNLFGAHDDSLVKRNEVRQRGGIFPEQQTFLGATIRSFNISAGTGSTPTTLNVELIADPNGTNPTIDDLRRIEVFTIHITTIRLEMCFLPPALVCRSFLFTLIQG